MYRCAIALLFLLTPNLTAAHDLPSGGYSPDPDITIGPATVSAFDTIGTKIVHEVENRRSEPVNIQIECSLYGDGGTALGSTTSYAMGVPPGARIVHQDLISETDVGRVECRVTGIQKAR